MTDPVLIVVTIAGVAATLAVVVVTLCATFRPSSGEAIGVALQGLAGVIAALMPWNANRRSAASGVNAHPGEHALAAQPPQTR